MSVGAGSEIVDSTLRDTIVGDGTRIARSELRNSLIGDAVVEGIEGAVSVGDHAEVRGHARPG